MEILEGAQAPFSGIVDIISRPFGRPENLHKHKGLTEVMPITRS
jgi:hypothetical protein